LVGAQKQVAQLVAEQQPRLALSTTGCAKCHLLNDDSVPFFERTVRAVRARDVWYEDALFNHIAHRAVSCRECHSGAYPIVDPHQALIELEPTLVPQVKKCMECHTTPQETNGKLAGGARSDCVECHRYHVGSAPLRGLGAALRDPAGGDLKERLSLDAFLRGERSNHSDQSP
jgi:hypothetical protein